MHGMTQKLLRLEGTLNATTDAQVLVETIPCPNGFGLSPSSKLIILHEDVRCSRECGHLNKHHYNESPGPEPIQCVTIAT